MFKFPTILRQVSQRKIAMASDTPKKYWSDSQSSVIYAKSRFEISDSLVERTVGYLGFDPKLNAKFDVHLDVGCGNGATTTKFLPYFHSVIGTDVSTTQVEQARKTFGHLPGIRFEVADAHNLDIVADSSVDLITCVAAAHWLNGDRFHDEVRRVLKPGGVLQYTNWQWHKDLTCPTKPELTPLLTKAYDQFVSGLYDKFLMENGFFSKLHDHVRDDYRNLNMPYEVDVLIRNDPSIFRRSRISLDQFIDYLSSISGYRQLVQEQSDTQLLVEVRRGFLEALKGDTDVEFEISWRWHAKMCRKPFH